MFLSTIIPIKSIPQGAMYITFVLRGFGVLEPGAADGVSSLSLTAPPHLPYHILTHALHVFVSCRRETELARRQWGICFNKKSL